MDFQNFKNQAQLVGFEIRQSLLSIGKSEREGDNQVLMYSIASRIELQ